MRRERRAEEVRPREDDEPRPREGAEQGPQGRGDVALGRKDRMKFVPAWAMKPPAKEKKKKGKKKGKKKK